MVMFMVDFDGLSEHFIGPCSNVESESSWVATDLGIEVGDVRGGRHKRFQDGGSFAVSGAVLALLGEFVVELLGKVFDFHFNNDNNQPNTLYCKTIVGILIC